jgi:hypothetical protein
MVEKKKDIAFISFKCKDRAIPILPSFICLITICLCGLLFLIRNL